MNCLRCELLRAKAWALVYHNAGRSAADLVNKLNATLPGVYFFALDDAPKIIYRRSDVDGSPNIEIWVFTK